MYYIALSSIPDSPVRAELMEKYVPSRFADNKENTKVFWLLDILKGYNMSLYVSPSLKESIAKLINECALKNGSIESWTKTEV